MHLAVAELGDVVEEVAAFALENVEVGPDLPVDLAPRDSISFSNERDELLEIPRLVDDVLGSDLSVTIDVGLRLGAVQHSPLAHGEQFVAVGTLVEVVALLFEQELELLHEEPTDQFVFSLLQEVQAIE